MRWIQMIISRERAHMSMLPYHIRFPTMKRFTELLLLLLAAEGNLSEIRDDVINTAIQHFVGRGVPSVLVFACSLADTLRVMKFGEANSKVWYSLTLPEVNTTSKAGIFVDHSCQRNKNFLLESSRERRLLSGRLEWLVWSEEPLRASKLGALQLQLSVASRLTWLWRGSQGSLVATLLYKLHASGPLLFRSPGSWCCTDLRGLRLTAAAVHTQVENDKSLSAAMKFNEGIVQILQKMFNFTLHVVKADSEKTLVEMLTDGRAEFAITSLVPTKDLLDSVVFVGPVWRIRSVALLRHNPRGAAMDALLRPLTGRAWLGVALLLLCLVLGLRSTVRARHLFGDTSVLDEDSWSSTLVLVLGALSMQGTSTDSQQLSWRLLVLLTFVLSLLLNTYYSASMTVALLLPPPPPVRSIQDLVASSFMHLGLEDSLHTRHLLTSTTAPVLLRLVAERRTSLVSVHSGLQRVRRDASFALGADTASLYPEFGEMDRCSLYEIPLFPQEDSMLPLSKNSHFAEILTAGIRAMWETGVARRLQAKSLAVPPLCVGKPRPGEVRLQAVSPALAMLGIGVVAATLILVLEKRVFQKLTEAHLIESQRKLDVSAIMRRKFKRSKETKSPILRHFFKEKYV